MTTMSVMAIIRMWCSFGVSVVLVLSLLITTSVGIAGVFGYNGVLNVKYKYAGRERSLTQLKTHDIRRQLRILAGVDLPSFFFFLLPNSSRCFNFHFRPILVLVFMHAHRQKSCLILFFFLANIITQESNLCC